MSVLPFSCQYLLPFSDLGLQRRIASRHYRIFVLFNRLLGNDTSGAELAVVAAA